jgi:hypothetical protein
VSWKAPRFPHSNLCPFAYLVCTTKPRVHWRLCPHTFVTPLLLHMPGLWPEFHTSFFSLITLPSVWVQDLLENSRWCSNKASCHWVGPPRAHPYYYVNIPAVGLQMNDIIEHWVRLLRKLLV